jgi:hypothetical protein
MNHYTANIKLIAIENKLNEIDRRAQAVATITHIEKRRRMQRRRYQHELKKQCRRTFFRDEKRSETEE